MKETATEQELTAEKVARSRKSVRGPGQFKNGGEIVLNTEQCRELNRVRARERRWNNTNNAVTQPSENFRKNRNARKNWLRRLQNFARRDMMCMCKESRMISSGDQHSQQEKSNVFCVYRGFTGRWTQREKVVNSLVYQKDLFSSVFATFAGSSGN